MRFNFVKTIPINRLDPSPISTSTRFHTMSGRTTRSLCSLIVSLLVLLTVTQRADAQRNVTYETLVQQTDRPNVFTGQLVLPSTGDGALSMLFFRMDYDLLPFRRVRSVQERPSPELEFQATARINMEVFRDDRVVTRDSWSDTVWTETYEQTRSRDHHLEGSLSTTLEPGEYRLRLEMNRNNTPAARPRPMPNQNRRQSNEASRERRL